ncbi:MAG TPA: amino acid ABC transporter permease [Stellaceae bacterium]|nr:amino acid ABC transporter permease [Stellaceae bacterium]
MTRALRWSRNRLFNTPFNALLTLLFLYVLAVVLPELLEWGVFRASFDAVDYAACRRSGGACWAFIGDWYRFILFGRFPYDQQWRPAITVVIFIMLLLASCDRRMRNRWLVLVWSLGLGAVGILMWGGVFGLPFVETEVWNGLPLTLILSVTGIGFSFPLAVLLALGRRSELPAIRAICVFYIEVVRGMPFIVFLFMGTVMVPLFLPADVTIPKLWRADIVFALFIAAYVAEVIRGGLQAIPRGQIEAAQALGLGYWRQMGLVVLPQALTISIPPLVGTFIGAFKDTALVTIVGFFDLLQDVTAGMNDPHWRGAYVEGYAFVAAIYFVFCYFMSRYSRYLEAQLSRGR